MNKSKQKGDRWERECRNILEYMGFAVTKSGGSLGLFDLIAIAPGKIGFETCSIQCRCNKWFKSRKEKEKMRRFEDKYSHVTIEIWRKDDRKPAPMVLKCEFGEWERDESWEKYLQKIRAKLRQKRRREK
ncbi:MAG: hypothetical protein ACTSRC_22000 [Candidatus Helarchaeota archaeon]